MTDHSPPQIPDDAINHLSSIFNTHSAHVQTTPNLREAIFSICQYVASHMSMNLNFPSYIEPDASIVSMIETIAKASYLRMRHVTLEDQWWTQDAGPLVGITNSGIPCALIPLTSGGYKMISSQGLVAAKVTPEQAQLLAPTAFSFYRSFPDQALSLKELIQFALSHLWTDFWHLFLLQAAISLIGLLIPIATGIIIESVIPTANFNLLSHAIIGLVVITFATSTFKISQVIAMMRLKFKSNVSVQAAVWDRLLRLPLNFFRQFTAGDLATRVNAIDVIQQTLTGTILSGILGGLFSLLTLGLMFFYDSFVGWMVLGLAIIGALVSLCIILFQLTYQRQLLALRGKNANLVFQFINGMTKLRAHASESPAFLHWTKLYAKTAKLFKQVQVLGIRMNLFHKVYGGIFLILFFMVIFQRIELISLFGIFEQTLNIFPLYERVQPILTSLPELEKDGINPGQLDGEISIQNLSFFYNSGDPFVLSDLNLSIRPGQFIALVGPSGCGKSTLFRLLLGFETPQEGKILYDGQNLALLNINALRRQVGVVLQSGSLLPGSILQNIVGAHSNLNLEDAWEAALLAAIDDFIQSLPMGMQTLISEEGRTFSMGQRQRLMIARAIANRPRILLLDEATSALDNATQAIVQNNLEKMKITRIVSAHRLSTIINADWIYVFNQKGRIIQQGSYKNIIKEDSLFKEIVENQQLY
jgi:NHLM bacteriocin system ABC transporter ATP-binding protein